jgi:hypothetical protein
MDDLWAFLPLGYAITILIETPVLLVGLASEHSYPRRLLAGIWLTACTYPIVILVFPVLFDPTTDRLRYLLAAETFAPAAECLLFWLAFRPVRRPARDWAIVTLANLASFAFGELLLW